MQKFLRILMLAVLFLPFALQAQTDCTQPIVVTSSAAFTEGFEGGSIPDCWTQSGNGTWSVTTGDYSTATGAHTGSYNAAITHGTTGNTTMLITPVLDMSAFTTAQLTFWHVQRSWAGDYDGLTVYYRTSNTGTWTELQDFSTQAYATWTEETITLTNLSATYQLAFEMTDEYGYGVGIDDITIGAAPTCLSPSALTASLTPGDGTVASLSWTENGNATAWQICLNGDENNLIDATTNPYDLTGLTPEAVYTAKVRAYCDATDQSDWSPTITFTPTNAYILTVNDGTTTNQYVPVYGTWVDNITKSQFIIPANDLTTILFSTINKLTFYASESSVDWGAAQFDVYMTETNDITLSSLADYTTMTQVYAGSLSINNNKMEVTFTTPYTYMGGNLMIGFLQTVSGNYVSCNWYGITATGTSMGGYGSYISQRNFLPKTSFNYTPGQQPDCMPVSNLTVSNITSSTATLTWIGDASSYTIYDMSDTSIIMNGITDNSYTITDLNPNTNYLFGVQANCTAGDAITVYTSARTTCAPTELPFTEDFSASVNNDPCWNGATSTSASEIFGGDTLNLSTPGWTYTSAERDGLPAGHYYVNIYGTSCNKWIITPEIDLTNATSPLLSFDAAFTKWNQAIPAEGDITDDIFMVLVSNDGGLTWDSLNTTTINLTSLIGTVYTPQYIDLSSHIGNTIRIAFYAESTVAGGDNDLHIDNINVAESTGSICYPVSELAADSVTANSVFLSWSDANNTGATYTIYNMADTSVVADNVNDLEYEVTGLTGSTNYIFGVVANCSATDASILRTVSATTDCENGSCQITITGTDDYGDGWNGASISVMQSGVQVGSFTVTGSTTTTSFSVCSGVPVSFVWNAGSYDDECDFTIYDGGNSAVFTANGDDVSGTFFTLADACPSCMPATALTVDAVTETSITISWTGTAASYDVYNGENFEANVTTTTYTFTGLNAGTSYVFGVQAICSADDSATVATIIAMTECANITSLPYNEGFEAGLGCWSTVNGSSDGMPWSVINNANYAHSGTNAAASFSYNSGAMHANAWLISPKFVLPNVSNDSITLSWWHRVSSYYPTELYDVKISTTTNDTAAFTATLLSVSPDSVNDYVHNMVDLTSYAGQEVYIAFHHHDSYDQNYLLIDDIALFQGGYIPPAPDTLTVTFEVDDATMGTTIPAPGTYLYLDGDTIHFGSQANAGFHFLKWEITLGGQTQEFGPQYANGYYVLASSWMHYETVVFKAFFEAGLPDSTTITYVVNDATMGTTTPAPGTYTTYVGDAITAAATANTGYELNAWAWAIMVNGTVNNTDTIHAGEQGFANPINLGTVSQNLTDNNASIVITAIFVASTTPVTQYTVTLNTADATMGTVSPAGANTVNEGSSFTATATALDGYHFVAWMNGTTQVSTANPYTFTVTGDITLTATFEANDPQVTYYNVTVSSSDPNMGNVTSTHSGQVAENTVVTVTATPNTGYQFVNWIDGEGNIINATNPYTFTVTEDITLIAVFDVTGINNIDASNVLIYAHNSTITVCGAEGHDVFVYDMNGRCIYQRADASETETISMSSAGIYLVRVDNAIFKKVVIVK
ncbi:MAG: choice-of-anchor J domain-containing protein [Bacteroidales bacterium]|nr:choice-of-anchor J domain-containing protein [Bacteroidales bacterium]